MARIEAALGGLEGRRVGLLGLAFKAGTDDVRDSPALGVAARLLAQGAAIQAHDPEAGPNAQRELPQLELASSPEAAVAGADAAVIATELDKHAIFTPAASNALRTFSGSDRNTFALVSSDSLRKPRISMPSYPYSFARATSTSKSHFGAPTVLKAMFIDVFRLGLPSRPPE